MNLALIHDWLLGYAGSERVVAALAGEGGLYPQAAIYALMYDGKALAGTPLSGEAVKRIHTSFLQRIPGARRHHRWLLPLMPLAIEQFDLDEYDLVISSNHAVAKGVLTRADQLHICYMHTPMRYAWDLYHGYMGQRRGLLARPVLHYLRLWDLASAHRVDHFIANSHCVARRIAKTYRREATVIYPPVEVDRFRADRKRDDFYLTVGRLVGYKRVDLIVRTFTQNGRPLIVIGDGPEADKVRRGAERNIRFLGRQSDSVVADYMERCRAFVFAADEDFGITPVEAQAAGAPVIALRRGGSLETVVDGRTGIFFDQPTEADLNAAIKQFEDQKDQFHAETIREHAQQFSRQRFEREFKNYVDQAWERFTEDRLGLPIHSPRLAGGNGLSPPTRLAPSEFVPGHVEVKVQQTEEPK